MLQRRVQRLETLVKQSKSTELSPPRRLQTAQDIIDLLQEQVAVLRAMRWADALQKARAIGYLAGIARKAIESQYEQSGPGGKAIPIAIVGIEIVPPEGHDPE